MYAGQTHATSPELLERLGLRSATCEVGVDVLVPDKVGPFPRVGRQSHLGQLQRVVVALVLVRAVAAVDSLVAVVGMVVCRNPLHTHMYSLIHQGLVLLKLESLHSA